MGLKNRIKKSHTPRQVISADERDLTSVIRPSTMQNVNRDHLDQHDIQESNLDLKVDKLERDYIRRRRTGKSPRSFR